ncbi:sensor histidine kinase [Luteolibacter arcticus]|uniref:Sensor histidine kinase n=1 Tax=Luteolibacter arcticus TaxID=1581411 RepID=A0ABT3GMR5_9BACT|nr:sensor histidine kinase [Luteolibacter arcticus]MCW1924761.1 sensor histidine kinase [Luteolibacter arcticus]
MMAAKTSGPGEAEWPEVMPTPELRIAAIYLIVAGLWVVLSDQVVRVTLPDEPVYVQTLKGMNFVLTTSVVLFFVLRRAYRGWRNAEQRNRRLTAEISECFRLLSARSEISREEERTRLSRELHDQLGQSLTGLTMDLRWVEGRLERLDDRAMNPLIDRLIEAEDQVQKLLSDVQSIAADLRPDALDRLGLQEALLQEMKRFHERTGIEVKVEAADLPADVPPVIATAAYRIVQEAMTNVARHSKATEVTVRCAADEGAVTVSVTDNGVGISPGVEHGRRALGLLGMRERAEFCGGTLRVSPLEGGGTEVSAVLPWKRP